MLVSKKNLGYEKNFNNINNLNNNNITNNIP